MDSDPRYEIDDPEIKDLLLKLGGVLKAIMPDGYGFTLFIFGYENKAMFYLSSAERETMLKALREFMAHNQ